MSQQDDRLQPRRAPRQVRGQQRVAMILDVAEALFAEVGYEATTTNQIAERAHVPIGSVYQFFPNKAAILHAVAARYRAQFEARYAASFAMPGESLSDQATRLVMAMVEYGLEHRGFTWLILFSAGDPELMAAAAVSLGTMISYLQAMIQRAYPALPVERSELLAHTGIVATKAVLGAAISIHQQDERHAKALVVEAQRLLVSYLERSILSDASADR